LVGSCCIGNKKCNLQQKKKKETHTHTHTPEVRITTRQLTKCEWNSGLASKNTNPLASLARVFPLSLFLSIFLASSF
jgi:hypothetical protein